MKPEKIVIVGSPGAGKTTIASRLSQELNLPHHQVDHVAYMPSWKRRQNDEIIKLATKQVKGEKWISDGIYIKTIPARIKNADLIIYVKSNPVVCAWRVTKRWVNGGSYQAPGCPSKVDYPFLKYILWTYPFFHKKQILNMLDKQNQAPVISIKTYNEIENYINER